MKKFLCLLLSASLLFGSATNAFAASNTKSGGNMSPKATAVMPAPTEKQVKEVLNKYYTAFFKADMSELDKIYIMDSEQRAVVQTIIEFSQVVFGEGHKVLTDVQTVKLTSAVKKDNSYTYAYTGETILIAKELYTFETFVGEATLIWSGKTLKIAKMKELYSSKNPNPKKSKHYAEALKIAESFGNSYVEAVKNGEAIPLEESKASTEKVAQAVIDEDLFYMDLMEKGQPIALELHNAAVKGDRIDAVPKVGDNISIGFDLGLYANQFSGVKFELEQGQKGLPFDVHIYSDGKYVESYLFEAGSWIDFDFTGKKILFEIDAKEPVKVTSVILYR